MKQASLFNFQEEDKGSYTKTVGAPIYEPKNKKPHVLNLVDNAKTLRLERNIKNSNLGEEEKRFLIAAAQRHTVFNYETIADYYSHASKEMQELMEESALVIIDFEKAIELGYINLSKEIKKQYLEEYVPNDK